jgi:CRP-like cAMP-binding protein
MTFNLNPDPEHLARLKALLAKVRHFDELPPEVQERLAASAVPRHFEAGQVIYVEGEPAESIYILEAGWVKATRMSREGREQAMLFLRPVEVFGDIAVFTGTTYPGTVVALEAVDVWIIPAKTILDLIPRHPDLAMAIIRRLSERVLHYIGLVEDLAQCRITPGKHAPAKCRTTGRQVGCATPQLDNLR